MPLLQVGLLAKQGFSLAKKHKVGAKLLAWGKKGFSLTGGASGINLRGAGVNASIGGSGAGATVAREVGGMNPMVLLGVGAAAFLLLKK